MASIVLLHSALGLRPAVLADAARLRAAGHEVTTPDLYDGKVFDDVDAGVAHVDALGREQVLLTARERIPLEPRGRVYAGYSMGAGIAQHLLETRSDAVGGLFISNGNPPEGAWPGVPCQAHVALGDEWVDDHDLRTLAALGVEVFRYPGGHLFTDPELPDHDPDSTERLWQLALRFLGQL